MPLGMENVVAKRKQWTTYTFDVKLLRRRNWDGSRYGKCCGKEETVDHLHFRCRVAVL
jgi:hypothetical protein